MSENTAGVGSGEEARVDEPGESRGSEYPNAGFLAEWPLTHRDSVAQRRYWLLETQLPFLQNGVLTFSCSKGVFLVITSSLFVCDVLFGRVRLKAVVGSVQKCRVNTASSAGFQIPGGVTF